MNYKDTRWKHKRACILRRDGYLCKESSRFGKKVPANTVHHIYPVEFYPELKYVDWNLISLSNEMHNAMHFRTTHNLTKKGLALRERFRPQYLDWCRRHNREPHFDN